MTVLIVASRPSSCGPSLPGSRMIPFFLYEANRCYGFQPHLISSSQQRKAWNVSVFFKVQASECSQLRSRSSKKPAIES